MMLEQALRGGVESSLADVGRGGRPIDPPSKSITAQARPLVDRPRAAMVQGYAFDFSKEFSC